MTLEQLVRRAQSGDTEAFSELMEQSMQMLYKTARAILSSDEDAADAIQDTILAAFEGLGRLKKPNYFSTWLVRILVNRCRDQIRKKRKLIYMDQIPEQPGVEREYEAAEWNLVLKKLDEKYRLLVVLHYVEGFNAREISEILDIPAATVRTRLARAKRLLAEYIEEGKEGKTE